MRIAKHISFFYIEERKKYIYAIIAETRKYPYKTDIFIHTNTDFSLDLQDPYTNGIISIVSHDLSTIHPFLLTWKCRDVLKEQQEDYDIFMYIEDDILVPKEAIDYWMKNHTDLVEKKYNLGFMRIETNERKEEYITDLMSGPLTRPFILNNRLFCVNDRNPYCAFWIYDKKEFHRFLNSPYYTIENIDFYKTREASAIGLHGLYTPWYKATVIPIENGRLTDACRIYHLQNNYVNDNNDGSFGSTKFVDAVHFPNSE